MNNENVNFEQLHDLVAHERWQAFRRAVTLLDPADLADLIEELPSDSRDAVFQQLDLETASDVLVELQPGYLDDVVEDMSSDHIADLAEQMAPDEAADFISELEDKQVAEVLAAMEPAERHEVRELLRYEEDSAGSIMTPEIVAAPRTATVAQTVQSLAETELSDPVFNVYVVEPESRELLGLVNVSELLAATPDTTLETLADRDYIYAAPGDDQQDVARRFRKYNLWVMPVVDENRRLLGRITVDDVIDVVHEEADEDLAHLVGAPDIDEEEISLLRITRMRLPWLIITMCAGLINSVIIKTMMQATDIVAIAIFVPAILAMGGNTGMQSSAICIRGIALGERKYGRLFNIMWREIRVGISLGIVCGLVTTLLVAAVVSAAGTPTGPATLTPCRLGLAVGIAMCNAMAFASSFGAVVPIILHRFRIDPALASGPFITTSNDLSASLIYFLTCVLLLKG